MDVYWKSALIRNKLYVSNERRFGIRKLINYEKLCLLYYVNQPLCKPTDYQQTLVKLEDELEPIKDNMSK